jgi:hypothetical protein
MISTSVPVEAPESVRIHLYSGRTFSGIIDRRTTSETLWLRSTHGEAVVLRPIRWERVTTVRFGDTHVGVDDFRATAQQLKAATPASYWSHKPSGRGLAISGYSPVVRSLDCRAHVANWDSDAESDGIVVHLTPLSDAGHILPVEGVTEVVANGYERVPGEPAERWSILARWREPLTLACYGPFGGVQRLSFHTVPLDLSRVVGKRVWLCVRLTAPGRGVFESKITLTP